MNNKSEVKRWLKDAQDYLKETERAFSEKSFRAATQNAQLCSETSCKGIISYFAEPQWTHSPGEQLRRILASKKKELKEKFIQEMIESLDLMGADADFAGPWHGISTYGEVRDGVHYPAVEVCTEEIAHDLLIRARSAYQTAKNFLDIISQFGG